MSIYRHPWSTSPCMTICDLINRYMFVHDSYMPYDTHEHAQEMRAGKPTELAMYNVRPYA